MIGRPVKQARDLFDAIYENNTEEAIKLLSNIAAASDELNSVAIQAADLVDDMRDDQNNDVTVLMAAIKAGNERLVTCILDMVNFYYTIVNPVGYTLDATDRDTNTALSHAVLQGNIKMVTLLLRTGLCDPTIKNHAVYDALDIAKKAGHAEIAALLTTPHAAIVKKREATFARIDAAMKTSYGNMKMFVASTTEPPLKKSNTQQTRRNTRK